MIDLDSLIREADPARELVVPQLDPSEIRRLSDRSNRSRRRLVDALAAGAAVAVALAVAMVVLLVGSHGRPSPSTATRPPIPAAARPLARTLGVLRRPQTAADRAVESKTLRWNPVLSLVRLAAVTPWGARVILVLEKGSPHDTLGLLVASKPIRLGKPGSRSIAPVAGTGGFTPSVIEAGLGSLLEGPGSGPFGGWRGVRLFLVVPDGVARVAFVRTSGPPVTVVVHDNVAFAQLTHYCCGSSVVTRWYARDGRLLKVAGTETSELGPPAINLPPGVVTVARLKADGTPFRLTLQRIRFEGRRYLCLSDHLGSGSSQQCAPLPLPDRPLVAVMGDPTVCKPHPAQLVWGLALTNVRVALRAGGRSSVATRAPVPAALGARGNLFYVWARSAPDSLVAQTTSGKVVETDSINSTRVPVFATECAQRPGAQLLTLQTLR